MRSPPDAPYPVASSRSRAKGGRAPPTFGGYPAHEPFEPGTGVGVETIGTDAGQAGGFDPPFPNQNTMHGAGIRGRGYPMGGAGSPSFSLTRTGAPCPWIYAVWWPSEGSTTEARYVPTEERGRASRSPASAGGKDALATTSGGGDD